MGEKFRIAIVGSGPAGLSAAAHAATIGVSHILLEKTDHLSDTIFKYQRGKHIIDVYVWPEAATAASRPTTDELNGYNVVHWTQDGMTFWAVSDVEPGQLRAFAAAWRKPS